MSLKAGDLVEVCPHRANSKADWLDAFDGTPGIVHSVRVDRGKGLVARVQCQGSISDRQVIRDFEVGMLKPIEKE